MYSKQNLQSSSSKLSKSNALSLALPTKSNIFASRTVGPNSLAKTLTKQVSLKPGAKKNTSTSSVKPTYLQLRKGVKRIPSIFGTFKASLEEDTENYKSRLDELEPAIKFLSHKNTHRGGYLQRRAIAAARVNNNKDKDQQDMLGVPLPTATATSTGPNIEKLITIGGYIISLQPTRDSLTTVIRPRLSTDKEGIEIEIKISGCHPTEIKMEKRYDTLIVIGVVTLPLAKTAVGLKSTYKGEGVTSERREFLKNAGFLVSKVHADNPLLRHHQHIMSTGFFSGLGSSPDIPQLDDLHEVVNIFVPKTISLDQVHLSKPDAKGRIFVKGP